MRFVAALAFLTLTAGAASAADVPSYVAAAIADPSRPKDDVSHDVLRDPAETLVFAGVTPGMKVAELAPEGGYYTRLLIDVVGPTGAVWSVENAGWKDDVAADQKVGGELKRANLTLDAETWGQLTLPGRADMVWTTQNYHDLHIEKYGHVDMAAFNRAVFAALKPGGVYFILDHAAKPGTTADEIAQLHRIPKAQVIAEVEAAGFKLAGEGNFLDRPADDLAKPVFDPAIRGRTSQFALKFVRP
ncbi:MAG: methyltransferase [Caulobacteraceae bacterium]|jgi:predicted methyltransferase